MDMLDILLPYQSCIVMIEQPFPVELMLHETSSTTQEREEWSQVKQAYNKAGFLIFADESMRTAQDLSKLVHVVNGVNIKMEKCGGYLNALQIIQLAQELQLDLWVGCMVGSMLNMNGAAALVGTKGIIGSDLDGSALVTEECQTWLTGGFTFHKGTIAMSTLAGMGLTMKNTFMVPRLQRWEVNWSSGRYSVPGQGFHQETVHPLLEKFSTPHLNLANR
jgi:L-alanine-DL-glutamate epimerase-like enolase superfamily enzyme